MPALSRKTVTVLFADVVDYTPLGEALDPEQLRALMSSYFSEMRAVIDAAAVEPLSLKGKRELVTAWHVNGVREHAPGRARRFDSEIVGRDDELALLQQAYVRALATRGCHLFTVLGPAGVGKSRVGREFLGGLGEEAAVLVGRCLPYGEGITYWPLREILHTLGDLRRYADEADAAVVEAAAGAGESDAAPDEVARAFRRVVAAVAREWLLVLSFEDMRWDAPAMRH